MNELLAEVVRSAESAVEASQAQADGALDYSESSLMRVEAMLAEAAALREVLPDEYIQWLVQSFGCYVLEVAHRQLGGTYAWSETEHQPVLRVGEPRVHVTWSPWSHVAGRLMGDEVDSLPSAYARLAERVRAVLAERHAMSA